MERRYNEKRRDVDERNARLEWKTSRKRPLPTLGQQSTRGFPVCTTSLPTPQGCGQPPYGRFRSCTHLSLTRRQSRLALILSMRRQRRPTKFNVVFSRGSDRAEGMTCSAGEPISDGASANLRRPKTGWEIRRGDPWRMSIVTTFSRRGLTIYAK
jgi:hypothetical protein